MITHNSKAAMRNLHVFRIGGMNWDQLAAIQKTGEQLPDKKALGVIQAYRIAISDHKWKNAIPFHKSGGKITAFYYACCKI